MALPSFFKLPNYKIFEYKPLYYDKKKEERKNRNIQIASELGVVDNLNYKPQIKGKIKHQISYKRQQSKISNFRLIILIFALLTLAYLLLF